MNKSILVACFVAVLAMSPMVHANEVDITPVTRDESTIAAQWAMIQNQLERVNRMLSASVVTTEEMFTVTIDEMQVINKPTTGMTPASAQAQCENIAYNTDHMWKLVTCTFGTETLYRDVFIAG